MKKHILFCLCIVVALSCKETPPEPSKQPTLSLNAEDASCTEAWLKLSTTEPPATVRLQRDGQLCVVLEKVDMSW